MMHLFVRLHNQRHLFKYPYFIYRNDSILQKRQICQQSTTEGRINTQKERKTNDVLLNLFTVHFYQINLQESLS